MSSVVAGCEPRICTVPGAHATQAASAVVLQATLRRPLPQEMGVQGRQAPPLPALQDTPGGQGVQSDARAAVPGSEEVPAGHGRHLFCWPDGA